MADILRHFRPLTPGPFLWVLQDLKATTLMGGLLWRPIDLVRGCKDSHMISLATAATSARRRSINWERTAVKSLPLRLAQGRETTVQPGSQYLIFVNPGARISDRGSKHSNKRERWKQICWPSFSCSHNWWRKKPGPVYKELHTEFLPKKLSLGSQKYRFVTQGTGSRIQVRIRNTAWISSSIGSCISEGHTYVYFEIQLGFFSVDVSRLGTFMSTACRLVPVSCKATVVKFLFFYFKTIITYALNLHRLPHLAQTHLQFLLLYGELDLRNVFLFQVPVMIVRIF